MSPYKKLSDVSKLVNQFVSSMNHKPFDSTRDKARVLAFTSALRDVLVGVVDKRLPKITEPSINFELTDEERKTYREEGLAALRKMKGNLDDTEN